MKVTAAILNLAARTVAFHKYRIMQDFGLKNNSELLRGSSARRRLTFSPIDLRLDIVAI